MDYSLTMIERNGDIMDSIGKFAYHNTSICTTEEGFQRDIRKARQGLK